MADPNSTDRNLLVALLAFQNNFIDRPALLTAFDAWTNDKSRPIAELLVEQKKLTKPQRDLIEALAAEHVKQHHNDPQQSLAALSSIESGRAALAEIQDNDLQQSLVHLRRATSDETAPFSSADSQAADPDRTLSFGGATSAGQRFRILRPHAEGGLGKVSVARDEELNREVALKEIKPKYADEPSARARFTLEAEITGGLEHPGIVPVYGLGTYDDGRPFYAMRFIRGDSLKDAIDAFFQKYKPKNHKDGEDIKLPAAAYQSLEFRQLLGRFVDVCNAIAHARGVLHRDLKPGNIMLGKYGETLVVDWGLAKATGKPDSSVETSQAPLTASKSGDSESGSAETLMGSAIGTIGYMSPEQAAGRVDQFGPATDIYLLGATLFHVLTGHPPHRGGDQGKLLQQIQAGKFPRPRDVNSAIPAPLAAIYLKAMLSASNERYGTAAEMAQEVDRFLADEPVTSYVEPVSVRIRRWLRKHPKSVATVAASLFVGLAGSLVIAGVVSSNAHVIAGKNAQLASQNEKLIKSNKAEKDAKNAMLEEVKQRRIEQEQRMYAQEATRHAVRARMQLEESAKMEVEDAERVRMEAEEWARMQADEKNGKPAFDPIPSPTKRIRWKYSDGEFRRKNGKEWVEPQPNGDRKFVERARTAEYVELYDASRDIGVRLYAKEMFLKQPQKTNYDSFRSGEWAE